ncbi:TRAP transporter small permease [Paracoccus sp. (in: a-proteobacteria)]|uniref:TRAP transporter small permease n=1 Tax=Paracoccus sp. TaxID=267 RepID=UPI0035B0D74A
MQSQPHQNGAGLLRRLDSGIAGIEAAIIGLSILAMALNTIANVFGRYVFSQSIYFSEEMNEILMVTVTFMGLGYVTRKGRHIRMSAVYDMLTERHRRWLMTIIALTTAAAMFLLTWQAWEYVAKVAARGRLTPAMQIPLWWTYVGVIVGLALTGLQYLLAAWANMTRRDGVWVSFNETDDYEDPELSALLDLQEGEGPRQDKEGRP